MVSAPEVRYYDQYGEYEGFRMFFRDSETRPFFIRMTEEVSKHGNNDFILKEGTVEKIDTIQDTRVIYLEDDTVIESVVNGATKS